MECHHTIKNVNTSSEALTRLPLFLRELLDSCPAAGDGVHFWIFRAARHLLAHFDDRTTFELIKAKATGCGRPIGKLECEITSQIRGAHSYAWRPKYPAAFPQCRAPNPVPSLPPARPAWPQADVELITRIVATDVLLVDLVERSPIRFDDDASHTEEIIDVLFPGDPLLCVGKGTYLKATRRREVWRGHLSRLPLIVPNPMLDYFGYTAEGRLSQHSKANTARGVYLVIEFDFSEFVRDGKTPSRWAPLVREWRTQDKSIADICAALHLHLGELLSLVCVTHSGGKSLHGWYYVLDRGQCELRTFMNHAVRLGADPATWTRSQFVRIPDGLRENGRRQRALYLDPGKAVKDE